MLCNMSSFVTHREIGWNFTGFPSTLSFTAIPVGEILASFFSLSAPPPFLPPNRLPVLLHVQ